MTIHLCIYYFALCTFSYLRNSSLIRINFITSIVQFQQFFFQTFTIFLYLFSKICVDFRDVTSIHTITFPKVFSLPRPPRIASLYFNIQATAYDWVTSRRRRPCVSSRWHCVPSSCIPRWKHPCASTVLPRKRQSGQKNVPGWRTGLQPVIPDGNILHDLSFSGRTGNTGVLRRPRFI